MILQFNKEKIYKPGCTGHVFLNSVTRVGNPRGLIRPQEGCLLYEAEFPEGGGQREVAPGAQRKKESSDTENSPDLLWVYSICQHLISVT